MHVGRLSLLWNKDNKPSEAKDRLTPREPDSASARVSGAKNAKFGYNGIDSDCKVSEPVTPPLACLKMPQLHKTEIL